MCVGGGGGGCSNISYDSLESTGLGLTHSPCWTSLPDHCTSGAFEQLLMHVHVHGAVLIVYQVAVAIACDRSVTTYYSMIQSRGTIVANALSKPVPITTLSWSYLLSIPVLNIYLCVVLGISC